MKKLTAIMLVSLTGLTALNAVDTPSKPQNQIPEAQSQTPEQNAIDAFKRLITSHIKSYQPNGRIRVAKLIGGWAKVCYRMDKESFKFDVEKTTSLISPLKGTITFKLERSLTVLYQTKAEAEADNNFSTRSDTCSHTHVFAYQDGQWQATSRINQDITLTKQLGHVCQGNCDWNVTTDKAMNNDTDGCREDFDKN